MARVDQVLKEEPMQSIIWDSEKATWNLSGSNATTDELNNWVKQLQQIEAENYTASYPSSLAPFGLDNPICRLIFYERDSKWHTLELLVGNRTESSGYYAMVKGVILFSSCRQNGLSYA